LQAYSIALFKPSKLFMKRITLGVIALVLILSACKNDGKKEETNETTGSSQPAASGEEQKPAAANQPKEYKVTITPDTAYLGKKKEALVKLTGGTAVALTDPDGKDNGIELTIKLMVTNKTPIGDGSSVTVSYAHSRLQLDNGTNITHDSGTDYLRAQPEATSKEESWTYKIPAGAKPAALNLFMDDTRVSVGVSLSEK
jgi:hypothetical protein